MHIKIRTGYSFRYAYGDIPTILDTLQGHEYAGICDRHGTWGFYEWERECLKRNIKPIFGVELAVVSDMDAREKLPINFMSFIALNQKGLIEIRELVAIATEKFYYLPRIDFSVVLSVSNNVAILSGDNLVVIEDVFPQLKKKKYFYLEESPTLLRCYQEWHSQSVYVTNNLYCKKEDENVYQIAVGPSRNPYSQQGYTLSPYEQHLFELDQNDNNDFIGESDIALPKDANIVTPNLGVTFEELVASKAQEMIDTSNDVYMKRLDREMDIIKQKSFEDYFLIVYDLVSNARKRMIVGPGRGSSCGSLICYILGITLIDPIKYGLLFERFIDLNRDDYPDIDIDFPDAERVKAFHYLKDKYGYDCVAKLGTISKFQPKSSIKDAATAMGIPLYATEEVKQCLLLANGIENSLKNTFKKTTEGQKFINRYPEMIIAADIEGHVRHSGVHAAGIVVCDKDLNNYCSIDENIGAIQLDKVDAENIGLLKIDVLGLRTLTVIQTTLDLAGKNKNDMHAIDLNCSDTFSILNDRRFAGIFQFEGASLQGITERLHIDRFDDIVALTSLCRPGPMQCGGTSRFLERRTHESKPTFVHEIYEDVTKETYGIFVYQEQVMQVARRLGGLSWPKVSKLRKAMSKSMGDDVMQSLYEDFKKGSLSNGLVITDIEVLWADMKTMGAYAFNKSHAVAYALISYWCMYLKYHFPLEFACACLRNAKDEPQSINILRELDKEGYQYKIYDKKESRMQWAVKNGKLVGSLTNIKGVGAKTAQEIIRKIDNDIPLTERQERLVTEGHTPYDSIFQARTLWGHILNDPEKYNVKIAITPIENISENDEGNYLILAKAHDLVVKDINSPEKVEQRGGKELSGDPYYLVLKASDDTGTITLVYTRKSYKEKGQVFKNQHQDDDYYLIYGSSSRGFKTLNVIRYKKLTGDSHYEK